MDAEHFFVRDQHEFNQVKGARRDGTCEHALSRKRPWGSGKTSHELSSLQSNVMTTPRIT